MAYAPIYKAPGIDMHKCMETDGAGVNGKATGPS